VESSSLQVDQTSAAEALHGAYWTGQVDPNDVHTTNLFAFYPYIDMARRLGGSFTKVRKLKDAIHGRVYMYKWQCDMGDEAIIVKLMRTDAVRQNENREPCEMFAHLDPRNVRNPHQEDASTEIGVLTYLNRQADCPRFLLRMLDSFVDGTDTWLVTEFCEGGEFFDHVANKLVDLSPVRIRRYMWQLLRAVHYMHSHDIGHRDISLENILITFRHDAEGTKHGEFRLMDFGGACRTRARRDGPLLRYFRPVGKPYYRPPEAWIPSSSETEVVPLNGATPSTVVFMQLQSQAHRGYLCEVMLPDEFPEAPGDPCRARLWGYAVPGMDVFACGVCFFIMSFGIPPWQSSVLADKLFAHVCRNGDQGIPTLLAHWRKEVLDAAAIDVIVAMTRPDPTRRLSIEQCLASPCLADMLHDEVPVHGQMPR